MDVGQFFLNFLDVNVNFDFHCSPQKKGELPPQPQTVPREEKPTASVRVIFPRLVLEHQPAIPDLKQESLRSFCER